MKDALRRACMLAETSIQLVKDTMIDRKLTH